MQIELQLQQQAHPKCSCNLLAAAPRRAWVSSGIMPQHRDIHAAAYQVSVLRMQDTVLDHAGPQPTSQEAEDDAGPHACRRKEHLRRFLNMQVNAGRTLSRHANNLR